MFQILSNSLRLTLQELKVNKLRTALSLTGIAFGIFCIIGVLATVNSLEHNIQNEVKTLGSNTIYIDKWEYSGGPERPWWKYMARPTMKYEEAALLKQRSELTDNISFLMRANGSITYKDDVIQNASVYGITESQMAVQPILFDFGRFISSAEFNSGSAVGLIGYDKFRLGSNSRETPPVPTYTLRNSGDAGLAACSMPPDFRADDPLPGIAKSTEELLRR
jgi:putative ABC transport system permease protein